MDFFNVIVVAVSLFPTVRLVDLTRTLRPTNFTVLICKKVHDGHLALSLSVFHYHVRSTWTPDPAFNCTDRALLQTGRFCSGYSSACLTFSTASLLRKLCDCYTGFFFKKRSLPKMRSKMTFLPTRSETISR